MGVFQQPARPSVWPCSSTASVSTLLRFAKPFLILFVVDQTVRNAIRPRQLKPSLRIPVSYPFLNPPAPYLSHHDLRSPPIENPGDLFTPIAGISDDLNFFFRHKNPLSVLEIVSGEVDEKETQNQVEDFYHIYS